MLQLHVTTVAPSLWIVFAFRSSFFRYRFFFRYLFFRYRYRQRKSHCCVGLGLNCGRASSLRLLLLPPLLLQYVSKTRHFVTVHYLRQILTDFYAPQLYRQVLLRRVLAMAILSVRLSVRPSRPGAETTEWDRDSGSSPYDSLESLASNDVILVPLGEEIPLERGHQRGVPPLEIVILPLLAHLAWKRLQIDTDLLRIITSTDDELSGGTNIDDLERPWTPKIGVFSKFLAILGCITHF